MAITAKAISRLPLKAACMGFIPASIWRWMFSSMTMASSTTRPMASTMASRVRVLMVKPISDIRAKAPISDTGMVTNGISVARNERRKMKMIRMTSATASQMVVKTLSMDSRMNCELSLATVMFMPSGNKA